MRGNLGVLVMMELLSSIVVLVGVVLVWGGVVDFDLL